MNFPQAVALNLLVIFGLLLTFVASSQNYQTSNLTRSLLFQSVKLKAAKLTTTESPTTIGQQQAQATTGYNETSAAFSNKQANSFDNNNNNDQSSSSQTTGEFQNDNEISKVARKQPAQVNEPELSSNEQLAEIQQQQIADVESIGNESPVEAQQQQVQQEVEQRQQQLQQVPEEPQTGGQQSGFTSGAAQPGSQPGSVPYIRLSNIATINSSSSNGNESNDNNQEMKLMRIYVIDLDQKLVVGNQMGALKLPGGAAVQLESAGAAKDQPESTHALPAFEAQTPQPIYQPEASIAATQPPEVTYGPAHEQRLASSGQQQPQQLPYELAPGQQQPQFYQQQQQQQVHYNNNNYTSYNGSSAVPISFVQAPPIQLQQQQQQDKHHANLSQQSVYHPSHHQESAAPVYQQRDYQLAEPAQAQQAPVRLQPAHLLTYPPSPDAGPLNHNEPNHGSSSNASNSINQFYNKASAGDQWKPVDYSAPIGQTAYSQPDQAQLRQLPQQHQPQGSISSAIYGASPAQAPTKPTTIFNGQFEPESAGNDHEVVSLNSNQQQQQARQQQPGAGSAADQSSLEAPRIPQTVSVSAYKHNKQQQPVSAYLAVGGPPIADGVYNSTSDSSLAEQLATGPLAQAYAPAKSHNNHRQAAKSIRNKSRPGGGGAQRNRYNKRAKNQSNKHSGAEPSADQADFQEQPDELTDYRPLPVQQVPRYRQHQLRQQSYHQRQPMYQQGPQQQPQPQRGLLSWETISSVASGAAKRLPALSSIFSSMPTFGLPQQYGEGLKQAAAIQPGPSGSGLKSAHYEHDVSAFHKPYPLRHMNYAGAGRNLPSYSDNYNHHPGHHQSGYIRPLPHNQADESDSYQEDLASSSSVEDHAASPESSGPNFSIASSATSVGADQTAGGDSTNDELSAPIISSEPLAYKATSNQTMPDGDDVEPVIGDLAEINAPERQVKSSKRAPKARATRRPAMDAAPAKGGRGQAIAGDEAASLNAEAAAVLSTIEQELAGATLDLGKPPAPRARPAKKKLPAAPAASSDSLDSSLGVEQQFDHHSQQVFDFKSLPVEQQKLLMQSSKSGKHLAHNFDQSANEDQGQFGAHDFLSDKQRPVRQPASVHIGQYKITPQTQFVQSILEPSRQMLGQYFKQYIGQLQQFG